MTDILFHEVPDAQVILRSRGVYRQAKVFRRGSDIYAAWGSGFIRLLSGSGTTVPTVVWQGITDPCGYLLASGPAQAPRWGA